LVTALATIIDLLPSLTDTERAALSNRLKAFQQFGSGARTKPADHYQRDEALGCVTELLRSQGVDFVQPAILLRIADKNFALKLPGLFKFLASQHPNRAGQRALLMIGLDLLYRDLAKAGIAVTAKVLLSNIHRIPATLDKHFPGYARVGMLRFIIDRGRRAAE
jgi:hypothetical protein